MLEATRCSGGRRRKVLSRSDQLGGRDFDELYRDQRSLDGLPALTPWDIGEPQPAVQQLVAYGALSGQVLDPGTGPGHHAIHFASKGYATTGIDSSPAAIDRAKPTRSVLGRGSTCGSRMQHDWTGSRIGSTRSSTAPSTASSWTTKRFYGNTCKRCIAPPSPGRGYSCSSRAAQRQRPPFRGTAGGQFRAIAATVGLAHRFPRNHDVPSQSQFRGAREHAAAVRPAGHCGSDGAAARSASFTCRSGLWRAPVSISAAPLAALARPPRGARTICAAGGAALARPPVREACAYIRIC